MSALDSVIRKLEKELEDRKAAYESLLEHADSEGRSPNEAENATLSELQVRMEEINAQLANYDKADKSISQFQTRSRELDHAIQTRREDESAPQYTSVGAYIVDYAASLKGDRAAAERLEVHERTRTQRRSQLHTRAADHQTTPDNPGLLPEPILGPVINFIDAARPIVSYLGVQPIPARDWRRPIVTQHTAVGLQGSNGGTGTGSPADEKTELPSQAMTVSDISLQAVTYGGYVNVSRQNIDFSSPQVFDLIVNDMAAQYSIQTEAAVGDVLAGTSTTPVDGGSTADDLAAAIWESVATVYSATAGQGRLVLAVAPDRLATVGPLFAPVSPRDAQSPGFNAGSFGQGVLGNISGVDVLMSAGLGSGEAFLFSTAAVECWEMRNGTQQVVEPSVLGVQVGYSGYFTSARILDNGGIVPITFAT